MYKSELARLAGVSSRTFARYLATRRQILSEMGISQYAQMLPPKAVKYVSEDYCIDLPEEVERLKHFKFVWCLPKPAKGRQCTSALLYLCIR